MTQQAQAQPTLQDVLNSINQLGNRMKANEDAMQEMLLWRRTAFGTTDTKGSDVSPGTGTLQPMPAQPQGEPDLTLTFKFWGSIYTWNTTGRLTDGHLALAAREMLFYADKFIQQRYEASQKPKLL